VDYLLFEDNPAFFPLGFIKKLQKKGVHRKRDNA
jgi:hypothetical protein